MNLTDQDTPEKRDPLAQLSHDLRTPLTSILGFSELLLDDESITGDSREYLTIIRAETERLADMLDEYVKVLRMEQELRGGPTGE